jgi:hypothetical protein
VLVLDRALSARRPDRDKRSGEDRQA